MHKVGTGISVVRGAHARRFAAAPRETAAAEGLATVARDLIRLEHELTALETEMRPSLELVATTHDVLGPQPGGRHIYVMVTAPSAKEAAGKG